MCGYSKSQGHDDPLLKEALLRARKLAHELNHMPIPDDLSFDILYKASQDKLFPILGRVGARPTIVRPFEFSYGCNISVGDDFFANHKY